MSTTKPKAHRHKFDRVKHWITHPSDPDDLQRYWAFMVVRECDCGATKNSDAEHSEVEDYIKNTTCPTCGKMATVKHETQSDCIRDLHLRVRFLETRLEKICDALSGIGR